MKVLGRTFRQIQASVYLQERNDLVLRKTPLPIIFYWILRIVFIHDFHFQLYEGISRSSA